LETGRSQANDDAARWLPAASTYTVVNRLDDAASDVTRSLARVSEGW
jgi:hypothetical protein